MTELIEGLPPYDTFTQHFHYSVSNWLPFYWRGFQQTTRYTYVLEHLDDLDALWTGLRENIRRGIRKAQKLVAIRDDLGLDVFQDLNEMTFRRQGLPMPYTRDVVARIDRSCAERGCRRILVAEDAQKRLHAGVYLVWDSRAAYYLIGGADPELRNSGAMSLLMWEAIQFASTVTKTFDFEGSMLEPVERFFRSFGADQKPYFRVTRTTSPLLKMKGDLRSSLSLLRARVRPPAR
jgi:lipid II:glycine glycyltransferase (peptidoglycan interpeptide bridge formation enzyme)